MHVKTSFTMAITMVTTVFSLPLANASPTPPVRRQNACPLSTATLDMIIVEEGARYDIYNDQLGAPTIGIGHKCVETGCAEVQREYSMPLTDDSMRELLQVDLARFEAAVATGLAGISLNANQYGAVVSVAFNGGEYAPQLHSFYEGLRDAAPEGYANVFDRVLTAHDLGVGDVSIRRGRELEFFRSATEEVGLPC